MRRQSIVPRYLMPTWSRPSLASVTITRAISGAVVAWILLIPVGAVVSAPVIASVVVVVVSICGSGDSCADQPDRTKRQTCAHTTTAIVATITYIAHVRRHRRSDDCRTRQDRRCPGGNCRAASDGRRHADRDYACQVVHGNVLLRSAIRPVLAEQHGSPNKRPQQRVWFPRFVQAERFQIDYLEPPRSLRAQSKVIQVSFSPECALVNDTSPICYFGFLADC